MKTYRFVLLAVFCLFGSVSLGQVHQTPPDDSKAFEVLVVGDPNSTPATWFTSHEELSKFASKVKFTTMRPTDSLYTERYAKVISGEPPLVLFQRAGGGVVYAADKSTLPYSADSLYSELKQHYLLAQNAVNAKPILPLQLLEDSVEDCPGGQCPTPPAVDSPVRWRPLQNLDPFGRDGKLPVENWFSDTTTSIMWAIGLAVVLGVLFIAAIVALALLYFLARFVR